EMLHTYTLIHDDLPCLDNDDFRRGKPSCHKVFGEAVALLAGDALLNNSFTLLLEACTLNPALIPAAREFSVLTGFIGIIGGQATEIEAMAKLESQSETTSENVQNNKVESIESKAGVSKEQFINIYKRKTACLFVGAVLLAAGTAGRKDMSIILKDYAENFGLAFQLKDDLHDNNNESFAHFFGEKETRRLVDYYAKNACMAARSIGCEFLLKLVDFEKYM
ncbi:MAG: polyprenyl synthetase family protein, partial [Firmicutes bacterium]|nr:polyprenyl synthetase family protein [Bacillota bacterium]